MKTLCIDKYTVGELLAPLFLPDIGTFFNQDVNSAREMIVKIKEAGALVLKGETLHRSDIVLNDETLEKYYSAKRGIIEERYREVIERKVVSLEDYEKIFNLCKEIKMPFVLSVYDIEGADFAIQIGASALKIASSNIVHNVLVKHVASLKVPIIIDTGKSTIEEIARAVQWAQDTGCKDIILEHSPEAPPSPLVNHNLRMLTTLKEIYNYPVGLSDHHSDDEMLYAATAIGVQVLEKGICPDNAEDDQDVYHALPIGRLAEVIEKCNNIFTAMGESMRYLPRDRKKYSARMGLIARRDVVSGEYLSLETVDFAFPSKGIPVEQWDAVIGWEFTVDLPKGSIISWGYVKYFSS